MTELADRVDEQRHNIESVSGCTVPLNLATAAACTAMLMPIRTTTTPMPWRLHVHPHAEGNDRLDQRNGDTVAALQRSGERGGDEAVGRGVHGQDEVTFSRPPSTS